MDSNTIRPRVSPRKSHKKIKVLRRPRVTVSSIISINDVLTNNEPNELNPSVAIPTSPITPSEPVTRLTKITNRINLIANERQYVIVVDRLYY